MPAASRTDGHASWLSEHGRGLDGPAGSAGRYGPVPRSRAARRSDRSPYADARRWSSGRLCRGRPLAALRRAVPPRTCGGAGQRRCSSAFRRPGRPPACEHSRRAPHRAHRRRRGTRRFAVAVCIMDSPLRVRTGEGHHLTVRTATSRGYSRHSRAADREPGIGWRCFREHLEARHASQSGSPPARRCLRLRKVSEYLSSGTGGMLCSQSERTLPVST